MKKSLMSMAAIGAIAIAAPATAQYSNSGYQGQYQNGQYQNGQYRNNGNMNGNVAVRIGQLQGRIQAGVQSGAISRQEAQPLRQQLRQLMQLERQYSTNGLSGQERGDLQRRIQNLRQQIRYAEGGQGRNSQYGDYDQDDRYGQYGDYDQDDRYGQGQYSQGGRYDRVDSNRDGYDDRDYDRDGRWDDDYQQGGYQQPVQRGGIGGVIDSLFGTGGLRVGQRASGNLYGVPSQYRGQYRDGNGSYFRSDGRQIYQIDARTQTVVRVYPMGR